MLRSLRMSGLALVTGLMLAMPAVAQGPVGRIAEASGPVSLRPPGGGWANVARGAALSEGQTVRTGPRSQVELDLGANRVGLDPGTVLRIDSAHPATPALTLEQGRTMVLVRSLLAGQVARVVMPRGSVILAAPGLYVIEAGDGRAATVGVSRGMAQVYGAGVSMMVAAGQTGVIGGADGRPGSLRAGVADGFLADDASMPAMPQVVRPSLAPPVLAQPSLPPPVAGAAPGVPYDELAELPGGAGLLRDGVWASNPEYGQVWYPPVVTGWSPYADAWAEDRAWGYTPWHFGTWIQIGPRWGWLPPRRHFSPGHGHHAGRPPPGVAQPHRPVPVFGQPPGYGGGRPPGVFGGPPRGVAPAVVAPPVNAPLVSGPRGGGWPPLSGAPVVPPQVFAPRPGPAMAGPPPGAAPQVFAPRPSAGPPMSAGPPRAAAPAPSRRCGPLQTPC